MSSNRRKADGEYKLGPASGMVRGLRYGEEELSEEEIDLMAEFDPNEIGERTEPRSYGHFTQQEWGEISDVFSQSRMASGNVRVHIDPKQLLETAKRRVESQLELTLIFKKKAKNYSLKEYENTWLNTKLFNPSNPIPNKIGDMVLKWNSNPHTFYYVQHHIIELVQPLKYVKSDGSDMTFEDRQLIADTLSSMLADDWGTMGSKNLYDSQLMRLTAEPSVEKGQSVLKLTVQGNHRLNMGSIANLFRQASSDIFGANVSSVHLEYGRGELSFVGVLGKSASGDEHLADFYKESDSDGNYMSVQNIKEIQDMANFLAQQVHNGDSMEDWVEDKISSARQMLSDLTRYYSNGEREMKGLENWKFASRVEGGAEAYFADIPYYRETREFAQSKKDTNVPSIDPKAQKSTPPTPSEIDQDDQVKTLGRVKVEEQSVKQDKKANLEHNLRNVTLNLKFYSGIAPDKNSIVEFLKLGILKNKEGLKDTFWDLLQTEHPGIEEMFFSAKTGVLLAKDIRIKDLKVRQLDYMGNIKDGTVTFDITLVSSRHLYSSKQDKKANATERLLAQWKCLGDK